MITEENGTLISTPAGGVLGATLTSLFSSDFPCASRPESPASPNFATTEGIVLFSDDFTDLSNWTVEVGDWDVEEGVVEGVGEGLHVISYPTEVEDGRLQVKFRTTTGLLQISVRRKEETPAAYLIILSPQRAKVSVVSEADEETTLAEKPFYFNRDWQTATVEFRDNRIVVLIGSLGVFETFDGTRENGIISLAVDGTVEIDQFILEE